MKIMKIRFCTQCPECWKEEKPTSFKRPKEYNYECLLTGKIVFKDEDNNVPIPDDCPLEDA